MPSTLLFADTFKPNTTPRSVHEVRFKRPVNLSSFRIVCDGEVPHNELPFHGQTPPVQLGIEFFGAEHGKDKLCTALLKGPHRRDETSLP